MRLPTVKERQSSHLQHMLSYSSILTPPPIQALLAEHNAGRSPTLKAPIPQP